MGEPDVKELASFKELLIANTIQIDTLCQLLIEKGLLTDEELYGKLREVQAKYNERIGQQ